MNGYIDAIILENIEMELSTFFMRDPTNRAVAWVNGQIVNEKQFFLDVEKFRIVFSNRNIHRVALFCQDTYRFACALFGAWQANVLTVLPTDMTEHTQSKLKDNVDAFVFDNGKTSHYQVINPCENIDKIEFKQALNSKAELVELFTSGSTGEPLRITKRLEQIFDGVDRLDAHFPNVAPVGSVVFSTVSHQHIYGFLWRLLWPLASSRLFTNERLFFPESIFKYLAQTPNSLLITSPAHLQRLPDSLAWQSVAHHLKMVVTSGGPLSEDGVFLSQRLFNQTPYEIFGSTELDGIAWRHRQMTGNSIEEKSTLWHPMPDTEVSCNAEGILQVRSARLDKTKWTLGNDRIELLSNDLFRLIGRIDRIAKIAEKRVSLTAIESTLLNTKLIQECRAIVLDGGVAIVAVPNENGRSLLSQKGKRHLIKQLRLFLVERFEAVMLPHRWRFEPMLPFDQRGKCTLEALIGLFDARHLQPLDWQIRSNFVRLTFVAADSDPHFKGHFPQFSLLPGVAQIEYVVREAHRYLKTPLTVIEGKNIKFMQMIRPNQTIDMQLEFVPSKNALNFVLHEPLHPDKRFAIGTLILGEES